MREPSTHNANFILFNAACNSDLTADQHEQLQILLRDDVRVRRDFVAYMDLHAALMWDMRHEDASVPVSHLRIIGLSASQQDTASLLRNVLGQESQAYRQNTEKTLKPFGSSTWYMGGGVKCFDRLRHIAVVLSHDVRGLTHA